MSSGQAALPDRCHTCQVRSSGLCSWFDVSSCADIARRTVHSRFERGDPILIQGEAITRVGIITSGLAKVVMMDECGEEHLVQLLHSGELVGDPLGSESALGVEAATDVELCWLSPAVLAAAIRQCPGAYRCQLDATVRQANELRFAQLALRGRNSLQRLAHWIHVQIPADPPPSPLRLRILLSRRDLASLLEMTVETLCRVLHQLEERGAITLVTPELIEVKDRVKLRLVGRAQEDRLQEALLRDGWEWGAKAMPPSPWLTTANRATASRMAIAAPSRGPDERRPVRVRLS